MITYRYRLRRRFTTPKRQTFLGGERQVARSELDPLSIRFHEAQDGSRCRIVLLPDIRNLGDMILIGDVDQFRGDARRKQRRVELASFGRQRWVVVLAVGDQERR